MTGNFGTDDPANQLATRHRAMIQHIEKAVDRAYQARRSTAGALGVIVADHGLHNTLCYRGRPAFIDFNDPGLGCFEYGLAGAVHSFERRVGLELAQTVLDGYISTAEHVSDRPLAPEFLAAAVIRTLRWRLGAHRDSEESPIVQELLSRVAAFAPRNTLPPRRVGDDRMTPARPRLHYSWVIFGVTVFTILAAAGIRSTPGVLIVPLEHEFGWSRALISGAVGANLLLFGLIGPFAAGFMERFGVRRVMIFALACIALGVGLTPLMRQAWQLYVLWGAVVAIGTGSMVSVLAAVVANRWFVARRGLVVGLLQATGSTGQLIFLPSLAWLVVNYNWRYASVAVAAAALLAIPVVALLMRERPADLHLPPYGGTVVEPAPPRPRNPFAAALSALDEGRRRPQFLLLAGSFFICGASTNGLIGTHLIPASIDHGIPEVTAAGMLAVIGVFDVIGTTMSGWLTDRFDGRWLLFWYYGLRGLSLLLLPFVLGSTFFGLIVFIVFYGLDWVATVPPTIGLTAETFGPQRVGVFYGWIFAAHQFGAAFAAYGGGGLRTWLGDYQVTFITAGLLCLLAAGMVLRIRTEPLLPRRAEAPAPA